MQSLSLTLRHWNCNLGNHVCGERRSEGKTPRQRDIVAAEKEKEAQEALLRGKPEDWI